MQFSFSTFENSNSFMHSIDARVKVFLLFAFTVLIFFCNSLASICVFGMLVVAAMLASGVGAQAYARMSLPGFALAAITFLFAVVNNAETGALQGLILGLRIVFLLLASFVVVFTTTSSQLVAAFSWFLAPLSHLRLPACDIAMAACLVLRFIPLMFEQLRIIYAAHYARAANFSSGGFIAKTRAYTGLFIPLFVQMFRGAEKISTAMDARCYGTHGAKRTHLKPLCCDTKSKGVLVGCTLFMATVIICERIAL